MQKRIRLHAMQMAEMVTVTRDFSLTVNRGMGVYLVIGQFQLGHMSEYVFNETTNECPKGTSGIDKTNGKAWEDREDLVANVMWRPGAET